MSDPEVGHARLSELAAAAADGRDVDWGAIRSRITDPGEHRLVDELEKIAAISKAFRTADDEVGKPTAVQPDEVSTATVPPHDEMSAESPTAWSHLRIIELMGHGSFGRVFRAWEPQLQREVALKLLDRVQAGAEDTAVAEARLLAQIRHENIVTVFGADRVEASVGFWMECVDGRTLRQMQDEQGCFSAQEALLIAGHVCRALAAVHRSGFVHGDIKAQNVMRQVGGRIVLMDFGAARMIAMTVTPRPRTAVTPFYVAPEVLLGGAPSVRSDIYSLGVLLYFMVTGGFPVNGESLDDIRVAHARRRRTLLRDVRPDLPAAFIRVVDAATAAHPDERPESAGAFEAMIESAADRAAHSRHRRHGERGADAEPSVAVLPFTDLSEDGSLGYFCHGIAEEIIDALSGTRGLRVVARTSAFAMDGGEAHPQQVGSALNVRSVLQGSVRAAGKRLRISARLTDVATGVQIWSRQFTRELSDIFGIQDEIARATVAEFGVRLKTDRAGASASSTTTTPSPDAYMSYLKGRYCWNQRTEVALQKSAEYFRAAIDTDPEYGAAHAALAEAYTTLGLYGVLASHDIMPRAKEAALRAIEIAPELSSPYATAGCIAAVYEWQWHEAARQYHRALEVNPGDPAAHHWYAINYLVPLRRFDEAAAELRRAADTDPLSAPIRASFGIRSYFAHEYEQACRELRETVDGDTGSGTARLFLGLTLVEMGRHDDAIGELETAARIAYSPEMIAAIAYACARAGHLERARTQLGELLLLADRRYVSPSLVAQVHAGFGNADVAVDWLHRASDARATDLAWLAVRPVFDALRSDMRFNALASKIG